MISFQILIFLAVLQGLTEFLPVSSKGHLAIAQLLMPSFKEPAVLFDLFLHLGTLVATVIYFWKELFALFHYFFSHLARPKELFLTSRNPNNLIPQIILSTLVTGVLAFPLKRTAENAFYNLNYIIAGYFIIAFLLFITQFKKNSPEKEIITFKDACLIGLIQGIAVFPGISRSGTTIAIALLLGIERKKAFTFSFLISLPAIAGSLFIESLSMTSFLSSHLTRYLFGSFIAMIVGYASLMLLSKIINKARIHYFAYYCGALALTVLFYVLI